MYKCMTMSLNSTAYNLIKTTTSDQADDSVLSDNPILFQNCDVTDNSIVFNTSASEGVMPPDGGCAESAILNKATWASAYIGLTSTVIGAGILGLPHAFASTGFVGGAMLLLFCGCSSALALHFLVKCAKSIPGSASFYSVSEVALPGYSSFIDLAVAIKCYGVATSYLIVVGDLMPAAMHQLNSSDLLKQRSLWIMIAFTVVAPLSSFQSLDALKYTSSLSMTFIMFLMIVIVLFAFPSYSGLNPCKEITSTSDQGCRGQEEYYLLNTGSLRVFSVFVFGYTCQQNIFSILNELREPSQARIDSVILCSVGTAFTVFLVVGLSGYFTYGSLVSSDLLKSYPEVPIITAARICVSLIVSFSYPLQCNPARRSVLTLFKSLLKESGEPTAYVYRLRYTMITGFFLATSLLIALTVKDLGLVLSIVGATGSTTVSYILPGLFYSKIFKDNGPKWKLYFSKIQFLLGLLIIPVCLTALLF